MRNRKLIPDENRNNTTISGVDKNKLTKKEHDGPTTITNHQSPRILLISEPIDPIIQEDKDMQRRVIVIIFLEIIPFCK